MLATHEFYDVDGFVYKSLVDIDTGELLEKLKLIPGTEVDESVRLENHANFLDGINPCIRDEKLGHSSNIPRHTYDGFWVVSYKKPVEENKTGIYIKNQFSKTRLLQALCGNDSETFPEFRNVTILRRDLGHSRYEISVVNNDTGEVIFIKRGADKTELFPDGCSAVIREVLLSREIMPNNGAEKIYVKTPDGLLYFTKLLTPKEKMIGERTKKGAKPALGRGRTRGRPGVVKVNKQAIGKLSDAALGFLLRMSEYVRYDTGLIAKRKAPLDKKGIMGLTNTNAVTLGRRFSELTDAGVLIKRDDGYYINREYITKG